MHLANAKFRGKAPIRIEKVPKLHSMEFQELLLGSSNYRAAFEGRLATSVRRISSSFMRNYTQIAIWTGSLMLASDGHGAFGKEGTILR